jgi:hypothetical protein
MLGERGKSAILKDDIKYLRCVFVTEIIVILWFSTFQAYINPNRSITNIVLMIIIDKTSLG